MFSVATLPIQNGVSTVGYTIYGSDLVEVSARSTANVVRLFEGSGSAEYAVPITMPEGETELLVIWDDGSGNTAHDRITLHTNEVTIEIPR